MPQRSSDVIEEHSTRAFIFGGGGLVAIAVAGLLLAYRGDGMLVGLAYVLALGGLAGLVYGVYCLLQVRKVSSVAELCPYCQAKNLLTESPTRDFTCISCLRLIPVRDGLILPVQQVRCGFCNELNYFSDKTEVLLCESCNHEIPISQADGQLRKKIAPGFAIKDDDQTYELVLVAYGHAKTDELISTLQQMLALTRSQVKQILSELPSVLLTGIPRRKAEMLQAQLAIHEAAADFRPVSQAPVR